MNALTFFAGTNARNFCGLAQNAKFLHPQKTQNNNAALRGDNNQRSQAVVDCSALPNFRPPRPRCSAPAFEAVLYVHNYRVCFDCTRTVAIARLSPSCALIALSRSKAASLAERDSGCTFVNCILTNEIAKFYTSEILGISKSKK